jgi:hypothetical protein
MAECPWRRYFGLMPKPPPQGEQGQADELVLVGLDHDRSRQIDIVNGDMSGETPLVIAKVSKIIAVGSGPHACQISG